MQLGDVVVVVSKEVLDQMGSKLGSGVGSK